MPRRLRVLFNVSGASYGHLYPLLPLANALAARGHEVAVAAPAYFTSAVRSAGFEPLPLDAPGLAPPTADYKALQTSRDPAERGRAAVGRYLEQAVVETPALVDVARAWRSDLVVRETTAYAGWLAGELLDLPVVVFDFVATPPKLLAAMLGRLFDDARAQVGLGRDPNLGTLNGVLHLVAGPPGWFPDAAIGPTTVLVQPGEPPDLQVVTPEWLETVDPSLPFVYVTLGTMWNETPGVFEKIFEALAGEDVAALATLGPDRDPASFGPLPERIRIEPFVPRPVESAVLARADVMICHGGYGALMNALRNGLGIVTVPLASSDTMANAARMEKFGVGVLVRESAEAIAAGVRTVLCRPYREAAARTAAAIRTLPALSSLAPEVERAALEHRVNREAFG